MTDSAGFTPITSETELRELLGAPKPRAVTKERVLLHEMDREWLAASPFCLIATSDAAGNCDVSPKGDPAGFVHVIDDTTIAIPERPGNRRADGFHNILGNPHVGLIFLVPGRRETLRVNGRARLVRDAPFFDEMVVKGHRPIMALVVEIEQIFFHCAKAFMRSSLWQPETWDPDVLPSHAHIVKSVQPTEESIEELERYYGPEYAEQLYR
jgi:PPOX class probable FMN-dependent enzyme